MNDHIRYSSNSLNTAILQLDSLKDVLSDVSNGLSCVNTSDEWWGKISVYAGGGRQNARSALHSMRTEGRKITDRVSDTQSGIRKTIAAFDAADRKIVVAADRLSQGNAYDWGIEVCAGSGVYQGADDAHSGNSRGEDYVEEADKQFLSWLESYLAWSDKTKSSDTAGLGKDGLSYIESLVKFFAGDKKGLTGASDWFDLGDKSIGLWSGFYGYLKKFYNKIGDAFSLTNQRSVAGLGIVGGIFGLISSAFESADKIKNSDTMGTAGIIGEVIGDGENVVDIWGGIEALKHVGESGPNFVEGKGIYSPLTLYSAIAKGYISAFSQGFTSYEKYAADGKWDVDDTARTGVEFSVSGLYSMFSAFGLVSEETTGISADSISSALEKWAEDTGQRLRNLAEDIGQMAGNYILNDTSLLNAYNNSGKRGQDAITSYAVIQVIMQLR